MEKSKQDITMQYNLENIVIGMNDTTETAVMINTCISIIANSVYSNGVKCKSAKIDYKNDNISSVVKNRLEFTANILKGTTKFCSLGKLISNIFLTTSSDLE